jgi:hypothetical protein
VFLAGAPLAGVPLAGVPLAKAGTDAAAAIKTTPDNKADFISFTSYPLIPCIQVPEPLEKD